MPGVTVKRNVAEYLDWQQRRELEDIVLPQLEFWQAERDRLMKIARNRRSVDRKRKKKQAQKDWERLRREKAEGLRDANYRPIQSGS